VVLVDVCFKPRKVRYEFVVDRCAGSQLEELFRIGPQSKPSSGPDSIAVMAW
jgi:hypothetical protein